MSTDNENAPPTQQQKAPKRRGRPRKDKAPKTPKTTADTKVEAVKTATPVSSGPERGPMRHEDPRAAAAARAQEILGNFSGDEASSDQFTAPPAPPGWTYEWKTKTVLGKEDPAYTTALRRTGWTPVPRQRHPEMMPLDEMGDVIERKGQILMERPEEITQRFRQADRQRATDQMRAKQEQLAAAPQGQFERQNKDASLVKVSKSYEPMPVPKD